MDRYVTHANVARFREMLSHELSLDQRHVIENLLVKEELRLRVLEAADDSPGEAISIRSTIEAVRWALPGCIEDDDQLTGHIVRYANERHLVVLFDQLS